MSLEETLLWLDELDEIEVVREELVEEWLRVANFTRRFDSNGRSRTLGA